VARSLTARLWRLLITPYTPDDTAREFMARAQTQESPAARVTLAVLDARESERFFGVPLSRRGVQPVYLRVENCSATPLRLQLVRIDPNYYTALEAAAANHFSIAKRLSAFGLMGWLFSFVLLLVPLKLVTAWLANGRMNDFFRDHAFRLRPVAPGTAAEGFVFTPLDAGTKIVDVSLHSAGESLSEVITHLQHRDAAVPAVEFMFSVPVPGIAADYLRRDLPALESNADATPCDAATLVERLQAMPPATSNKSGTRAGDPVNLVVIGAFDTLLATFSARWDESESITLATCWKTVKSFLLGTQYRYSPVSALNLFGRSQDVALQRTRHSINDRLHLRLWLTPLRFQGQIVWVGQVSRDIGVRFTTKTWNLTTHRIDPDVDEARDYVVEDLLHAERVTAAGYVEGVGACTAAAPRHNLTHDTYFTDGKRAVVVLSETRTAPTFVAWT
jgi:hypothetical protein